MDFSFVSNFISSLSGVSLGLIILVGAVILSAVYALLLGKDKILAILFATYASFAVIQIFPFDSFMDLPDQSQLILYKFILFLVGLVLFSLIFIFTHATRGDIEGFFVMRAVKGILFGVAQIGFLASVILSLVPYEWLVKVPDDMQNIFMGEIAELVWFVVPILIILFTKDRRHKGPGRPRVY